jgi:hypothetical protein
MFVVLVLGVQDIKVKKYLYIAHLWRECHDSNFDIFWVIAIEKNVCRCTFNRYSVITQFAELTAGQQLCRQFTHKKL